MPKWLSRASGNGCKVGYKKNEKGERARAWQYHGSDYREPQQATYDLGEKWEAIIAEYRKSKEPHNKLVWAFVLDAARDG